VQGELPTATIAVPLLLSECSSSLRLSLPRPLPAWDAPLITPPVVQPIQAAAPSLATYLQKMRSMSSDELATEYQRLLLDASPQARLQQAQ